MVIMAFEMVLYHVTPGQTWSLILSLVNVLLLIKIIETFVGCSWLEDK